MLTYLGNLPYVLAASSPGWLQDFYCNWTIFGNDPVICG